MTLTETELHIWHIQLGSEQNLLEQDFPPLPSTAENQRLSQLAHLKLRQSYLKTRWSMREILARYLNTQACKVQLSNTNFGKPVLSSQAHTLDLQFNLTHSGDKALLAVALGSEVGVDMEQPVTRSQPLRLAARYFTPAVVAQLANLTASEQNSGLLKLWTQYEAFKKAQGLGLRGGEGKLPLNMLLTADQLTPLPDESGGASGWLVAQFEPFHNYNAAVVVKANQPGYQIRHINDH